jgi:hypothetical protein
MIAKSAGPHSAGGAGTPEEPRDFPLGVAGFSYADLHDPQRLAALAQAFDAALAAADAPLYAAFDAYRRDPASLGPVGRSELIVKVAGHLSRFVARLFALETPRQAQADSTLAQADVFAFKRDFVQRRALKRAAGQEPAASFTALHARLRSLCSVAAPDIDCATDPELGTARVVMGLVALQARIAEVVRLGRSAAVPAEARQQVALMRARLATAGDPLAAVAAGDAGDLEIVERMLGAIEDWAAACVATPEGRAFARGWVSFRFPEDLDPNHLVAVEHPDPALPQAMRGPAAQRRRRDGFKLTDRRMAPREILDQAHYCVICHERDKDSCSKGLAA